jgi:hypothetical protein
MMASIDETGDDEEPEQGDDWIPAERLAAEVTEVARAGGADAAAALVGKHWDRYSLTSPADLLAAIRALPGEVFVDNAGMVAAANYLQQVLVDADPGRFGHDARLSVEGNREAALPERLILLTSSSASARTAGRLTEARDAAVEARRRLARADPSDVSALRDNLPHLMLQWGRTLDAADEKGAAYEYEEAHRLASLTGQQQVARRAASHLAWLHADRGRLELADRWLERARTTGDESERYEAVMHLVGALLLLDRQEQDGARSELARMRDLPLGEYFAAGLWVRSLLASTTTEVATVEMLLQAELERQPVAVTTGGATGRHLRMVRLRLGLPARDSGRSLTVDECVLDGLDAYWRGDFHTAIEASRDGTSAEASPRTRSIALIVTAAASHALSRPSVAAAVFERAHAIIERAGLRATYGIIDRSHLEALAPTLPGHALDIDHVQSTPRRGAVTLGALTRREREVLAMLATEGPSPRSPASSSSPPTP